jgi:flagellar biosynthesis chaperone FliJ
MNAKTLNRTLTIKERIRQWRRAELQEAETLVVDAERSVDTEAQREAGAAALITKQGECSATDLAFRADQLERSKQARKRAEAALQQRQEERETRRGEVGEATREVRAIEALRTRIVTAERHEADKREQRDLDEAASRKKPT